MEYRVLHFAILSEISFKDVLLIQNQIVEYLPI